MINHTNITIKDIAELAGVSYSTVSRCLNDSPLVSENTRRKVSDIADELGFEFNAGARSLITRKSGTVGIVLPDEYSSANVNVYHGMLMNSLRSSLEKAGVDLIVTYLKNHFTGKNNITRLITMNKVDGLIFLTEELERKTIDFLESRQVPFVCTHYPPSENIINQDVIYTDHYAGGRIVANHLLNKGNSSFLLLGVEGNHTEFKLREEGFTDTIKKSGKKLFRLESDYNFNSAYSVIKKKLSFLDKTDGIFALNDLMAIGVLKALTESGGQIPDDFSLVGYDDTELCEITSPRLTSVHQPREEIAVLTCDRLFFQMDKRNAELEIMKKCIKIEPVLKIRESS